MGWWQRFLASLFKTRTVSAESPQLLEPESDVEECEADGPVEMPITDAIDLHTFAPKETASVVDSYLHEALAAGFLEVRIIHGRGKGVQRNIVRGVLARHPCVDSFADAPPGRGGWGATIVVLRSTPVTTSTPVKGE